MHQQDSRYRDHLRVAWARNGSVAYIDFTGNDASYYVGEDARGGFKVVPPRSDGEIVYGFSTMDEGIDYALRAATR